MPVYEFICKQCEFLSEQLIMNSYEKPKCPQCGSDSLIKQFSVFGFISGNKPVSSTSSSNCSTCSTHNCGSCH